MSICQCGLGLMYVHVYVSLSYVLGSALMNTLFGAAFWLNVHSIWFFIVVQVGRANCIGSVMMLCSNCEFLQVFPKQLSLFIPSPPPHCSSLHAPLPQLVGGVFHSTGWPGVIAVMSNWFGKGK